jgi:iduronate 2-sulfatase
VQPGQHPGAQPDAQPGAQPGAGRWSIIKPGHGVGFRSDGEANTYSDRFGVELTFARRIAALHPDRNIAIIKYSRGGTSISRAARSASRAGCWDPDFDPAVPNQLDHAVATIKAALAAGDIDGDGSADTLIPAGIVWMQGESDGADRGPAQDYGENLRRVMDALSEALGDSAHELPVAIGLISDSGRQPQAGEDGKIWDFGEHVRLAQADYCDIEARAVLVDSTDEYGYSDPYHYDTAGYIDLGRKFAEAIAGLEKKGP